MGLTQQDLYNLGYRVDISCTLPKSTAATEAMIAHGAKRGRKVGSTYILDANIVGKTFKVTDSVATVTSEKTITFKRSDFANPQKPLLSEVVTALNAVLSVDATPTVASSGAFGQLIITGAATGTTQSLTIGAGTANVILGFPKQGYKITNGTGIDFTLDAEFAEDFLYTAFPKVFASTLTIATGVKTAIAPVVGFTAVFTPSTRVLRVNNGSDNTARVAALTVSF